MTRVGAVGIPVRLRRASARRSRSRLALGLLVLLILAGVGPARVRAHPSAFEQVEKLGEEIRARPEDPANYLLRGRAYSNEGHFEEALADYEKAAQMGDPIQVAYDLGVLRYRMGNLTEARRQLDLWLEHHPGHPPALEYRARVLRDSGEAAAAVADYRAYFESRPNPNPGDYVAAARLLEELEGEGVPGALALLDAGMARLGTIPQLQRPAIALERRRGRLGDAIRRLESLEPALGGSPDWKIDMAELLLASGRKREADRLLDTAAEQLEQSKSTAARVKSRQRLEALRAGDG